MHTTSCRQSREKFIIAFRVHNPQLGIEAENLLVKCCMRGNLSQTTTLDFSEIEIAIDHQSSD